MKLSQKLTEELIQPYFSRWEHLNHVIADLHKERKTGSQKYMEQGIALYRELLAHCSVEDMEKPVMPLNGEERLLFIEQRPGSFAAYRQLDELFREMKKIIAARRIQSKRQKNPRE